MVAGNLWRGPDIFITGFLQSRPSESLDCAATSLSWIGSAELTGAVSVFIFFFLWKRLGPDTALAFGGALGLATAAEIAFKVFLPQMPIPDSLHRACGDLPQGFIHVPTPNSFPSGHTFRTTFLLFMIIRIYSFFYRSPITDHRSLFFSLCLLFVLLMAVSRVYIGDHWLSDVLGGILLAWAAVLWVPVEKRLLR